MSDDMSDDMSDRHEAEGLTPTVKGVTEQWFSYPGPKAMSAAGMGHYDEGGAVRDDFIRYRNPTARTLSTMVELGVDPSLQVKLYKMGYPRGRANEPEAVLRVRMGKSLPVHPSLCRTRVEVGPGEIVALPRDWRNAIRTVFNGKIIGGLMPQLLEEGPGADNPPLDERIEPETVARSRNARPVSAGAAEVLARVRENGAVPAKRPRKGRAT